MFYNLKAMVHSVKILRVKVFLSSFEYIMQQTEHSDNIFKTKNIGRIMVEVTRLLNG